MEAPEPRTWQDEVRQLQGLLDRAGLGVKGELRSALADMSERVCAEVLVEEVRSAIELIDEYGGCSISTLDADSAFDDIEGIAGYVTEPMPRLIPILDACAGDQEDPVRRLRPILEASDVAITQFNESTRSSPHVEGYAKDLSTFIAAHVKGLDKRKSLLMEHMPYGTWADVRDAAESVVQSRTVQRLRVEQLLGKAQLLGNATALLLNEVVNAWSAPEPAEAADYLWAHHAATYLAELNEYFDRARGAIGDRAPTRIDATQPDVVDQVWAAFQGPRHIGHD